LSAISPDESIHQAYLCLGSNINPAENMRRAVDLLQKRTQIQAISTCWETEAVGSPGPNFLNLGVKIQTPHPPQFLKEQVLLRIENELGRVRGADKYASRTIDLDISLFDGVILDPDLWKRVYLALIFAELAPGLSHPQTGESIDQCARRLLAACPATPHPELKFGA
jgi:2-amino-4-hydroxy-6-hydroxymethyldihydropteridine diphosphokinase